jgi:chromosome segregation ATPase
MQSFSTKSHKGFPEFTSTSLLENEIESLMLRLDNEKRESDFLDEQIRILESDFASTKASKHPGSLYKNPLFSKLTLIEKQIEYETAQYDALKSENADIRREINEMRLENTACKKSLARLSAQIQTSSSKAIRLTEMKKNSISIISHNQSKITAIRSRSTYDKQEFGEKVRELSFMISKQRGNVSVNSRQHVRLEQLLSNVKGCNIFNLQSALLSKWSRLVKDKRGELDGYRRYIQRLKTGFEDIRTACGIVKVEDMVTQLIKSEDQNQSLYRYLCGLNGDIDQVEDLLKENTGKIEILQGSKDQEEKHVERLSLATARYKEAEGRLKETLDRTLFLENKLEGAQKWMRKVTERLGPFYGKLAAAKAAEGMGEDEMERLMKMIDDVMEKLKAALDMSRNQPPSKHLEPKAPMPARLSGFLEQKELYEDADLADLRNPLPAQEFTSRAVRILHSAKGPQIS